MLRGAGLGKIKARDNAALWGTDAECKLRQPDDPFYKKFAAECSRVQIAVDIFAMGCTPPLPPRSPADARDLPLCATIGVSAMPDIWHDSLPGALRSGNLPVAEVH